MDTALGLKAKSVIVFTDEIGWHTDELSREFTQRKINCTFIDLAKCNLMMKGCMANISFGEGNDYSPAAAFVRGISGGSLEQITKRLAILHCLASLKVPVINQPSAIEKSVDKGTTSFLLKKSGIPTPDAWLAEDIDQVIKILNVNFKNNQYVVFKPLFGSQGKDIERFCVPVTNKSALVDFAKKTGGVFYMQAFIPSPGNSYDYDLRILVLDYEARFGMIRRGKGWIHNVSKGAECFPIVLSEQVKKLAEDAAKVIGLQFAGVDLLLDHIHGYQVIEVNGIPAWRGAQSVCSENISERLVEFLVDSMNI